MGQSTLAAARRRARTRNRSHLKRSSVSDISPDQELAMRLKARKCPLCGIRMRSEGGKPDSKELDHIVPIVMGGTHTHGNVRIICRRCNQRRPKDGGDYSGPVTLWAQGETPVKRQRKKCARRSVTCGKGLHPWVPSNIKVRPDGKRRCIACDRERGKRRRPRQVCGCGAEFAAPGRTAMCPACIDAAARKAAELHATGLTWSQVAPLIGYGTAEGARYAARRIGYAGVRCARPAVAPKAGALCQCGAVAYRSGRCHDCMRSLAERAAALYADGWTLRQVGAELGYSSPTSVSNAIKSVSGDLVRRRGRPSLA